MPAHVSADADLDRAVRRPTEHLRASANAVPLEPHLDSRSFAARLSGKVRSFHPCSVLRSPRDQPAACLSLGGHGHTAAIYAQAGCGHARANSAADDYAMALP